MVINKGEIIFSFVTNEFCTLYVLQAESKVTWIGLLSKLIGNGWAIFFVFFCMEFSPILNSYGYINYR